MKNAVTISMDEGLLKSVDTHPLRKNVSRSGIIGLAVTEFLERQDRLEKNKNENSKSGK